MPYRRKDCAVWWVFYIDADGKRVRRSTGTTDLNEAKALEAKWKLEAFNQQKWEKPPSRTFEELMVHYLKATEKDKRPLGHRRDKDAIRHLWDHFHGRELAGLTAVDVRGYVGYRRAAGVCDATINRELCVLSAAINYARSEWEWEIPNPVSGRKLKEPEGRTRWLTRAEAEGLIRAAEAELQALHLPDFIRLALHTGMRKGELLGLECSNSKFGSYYLSKHYNRDEQI